MIDFPLYCIESKSGPAKRLSNDAALLVESCRRQPSGSIRTGHTMILHNARAAPSVVSCRSPVALYLALLGAKLLCLFLVRMWGWDNRNIVPDRFAGSVHSHPRLQNKPLSDNQHRSFLAKDFQHQNKRLSVKTKKPIPSAPIIFLLAAMRRRKIK